MLSDIFAVLFNMFAAEVVGLVLFVGLMGYVVFCKYFMKKKK